MQKGFLLKAWAILQRAEVDAECEIPKSSTL